MSLSSRAASIQSTSGRELIDEVPWRRGNEVAPGLFVGDLETARALRFTSENKISAVVSVCADYVSAEDSSFGMWHLRVNVTEEGADLLTYLPRAVAFVAFALSQGRRVLVHSVRGQSRAPAVAAAYLMQTHNVDATTAIGRIRARHEPTWIQPGLHEQLVLFRLCNFRPEQGVPYYDAWRAKMG